MTNDTYVYDDASHVHAATYIGSTQNYWYDANSNQTTRIIGADTYTLLYDADREASPKGRTGGWK